MCGIVEGGGVDIRGGEGRGGLSGYRWAASLDLKQSRDYFLGQVVPFEDSPGEE